MFTPYRLAAVIWTLWLLLLSMLVSMLLFRIHHPHFFLVTVLLVGLLFAEMSLIGTSVWQIACGRNKTRAAAWLLIGTAPFVLTTGHFLRGLRDGVPLTFTNKILIPFSESLMDLESRLRYPMRTVGAKVVMISPPVEDAAAQVAAMDEHVRQLEMRLGHQIEQRIYWVRGSLLGKQGKALVGVALGTSPQDAASDKQELDPLDRHEVAHCVIHMLCPLLSQPPSLLLEGWAEANSGHDEQFLADRVWVARQMGLAPALSTLTGYSETSSRSNTALYLEGGPLVNYLLQQFGSERFMQLYAESRQATFAADCQRILGMEVADLDAACWGYVEKLVEENGPPGRRRLMQLTLGPAVDPAVWREFLDEYFMVVPTWNAKIDSCEQVVEVEHHERNDDPKTSSKRVEYRLLRSGVRQALSIDSVSGHRVYVAVPQSAFTATRVSLNEPWTIQRATNTDQDDAYWSIWQTIRDSSASLRETAALFADDLQWRIDPSTLVVTDLKSFRDGEEKLVRLRLENRSSEYAPWRAAEFVFSETASFALRSSIYQDVAPHEVQRREMAYDLQETIPVIRSVTTIRRDRHARELTTVEHVKENRFGAIPAGAFSAEHLLGTGPVVAAVPVLPPVASGRDWPRWIFRAGLAFLMVGIGLLGWQRTFPSAEICTEMIGENTEVVHEEQGTEPHTDGRLSREKMH